MTTSPGPHPSAHLGSQMCCHGVGLSLEIVIQGLYAAEERAGEHSLQATGPFGPCQASQRLPRSSAHQLDVVEHHTELGRYGQRQLGSCQGSWGVTPPSHLSPYIQPLTCSLTASPAAPGWVSTFFLNSSV